ncbi:MULTISPECIES: hypothetical protein [unclassified Acidovorax]|uniref:hypothetical protein n=1 Tax=unclassified Acidovorax TaxID=2684926 RepID=UPI001C48502E|nr:MULTISPECIES: hypothetical protein [unclassified Acidovorax]MBV7430280.1 hypothetical protein [Acidovorax sp. sif0732]MBV7451673.1 hypothetical protein [Acidovorax sp. sif0715]
MAVAVVASVLLHGVILTAWNLSTSRVSPSLSAPPQPFTSPRQAMEVQWITHAEVLQPAMAVLGPGRAQALPKGPVSAPASASRPVRAAERHRSADAPTDAVTGTVIGTPARAVQQPPPQAATAAAPAPELPASDSRMADAPLRWSPDAVGRADRQEREWQRRHGAVPAAQLAVGDGAPAARPLGAAISTREWRGGDGSRVTQVESPSGTYCVRLPSANRLPDVGAAPRVAPVSNCP